MVADVRSIRDNVEQFCCRSCDPDSFLRLGDRLKSAASSCFTSHRFSAVPVTFFGFDESAVQRSQMMWKSVRDKASLYNLTDVVGETALNCTVSLYLEMIILCWKIPSARRICRPPLLGVNHHGHPWRVGRIS